MYAIDLNSDLGESFGMYKIGCDDKVIPLISSANIACGFHAGDPSVMSKTVALCKENSVAVGAHPGFPDLQGFGRRNMAVAPDEIRALITYQVGALDAFCKKNGLSLQHVKPHGALYNMAAKDEKIAKAICDGISDYSKSLVLLGLSGSKMLSQAQKAGLPYAAEVFADRAYEDDGTLVARGKEGAIIKDADEATQRVVEMIKLGRVKSINGNYIEICPHSVCVHGDSEKALIFTQKIRDALTSEGIIIQSIDKIIQKKD